MRTHGINRSTFFKWRRKYGEANVSDVTRLREFEAEHARLKLVYADLALEKGSAWLSRSIGRFPTSRVTRGAEVAPCQRDSGSRWGREPTIVRALGG